MHGVPTLEERMDDVRAVMDAAGSERAIVLGTAEGAAMTALFAATYPERTLSAILYGAYAYRPLNRPRTRAFIDEIPRRWGTEEFAATCCLRSGCRR
jgi:pimeloyl-ACP methyl ester carboxylesterase